MNFSVCAFDKNMHSKCMQKWLRERGIETGTSSKFLPPTGFVVHLNMRPIAIGFLIKCDNGMAINSDLVSNPSVSKEERNAAVAYLRECLYAEARKAGLEFVTVFTSIPEHAERLRTLGYMDIDKNLIQLGRVL